MVITLARAMRERDRRAGRLRLLRELLRMHGKIGRDRNLAVLYREQTEQTEELVALRIAIAKASAPIAAELTEMCDLRERIRYFSFSAAPQDGKGAKGARSTGLQRNRIDQMRNRRLARRLVACLQERLDLLQDQVDEFKKATLLETSVPLLGATDVEVNGHEDIAGTSQETEGSPVSSDLRLEGTLQQPEGRSTRELQRVSYIVAGCTTRGDESPLADRGDGTAVAAETCDPSRPREGVTPCPAVDCRT